MTVRHSILRTETRGNDIRSEASNHPNDIREDFVVIPEVKRLLRIFGKTEVDRTGEKLLAMIDPPRGQQLFRPNET